MPAKPRFVPLFKVGGFTGAPARPSAATLPYSYRANKRGNIADKEEGFPLLRDLYDLTKVNNAVRRTIQVLRDTIFVNGYEWKRKFSAKCNTCMKEYPEDHKPDFCGRCGANGLDWAKEPDEQEITDVEEFFKRVDKNGNSIIDVLKMYENHLNVADDGFLVCLRAYNLDEYGRIRRTKVKELFVADPLNFKLVIDEKTRRPGGSYWLCLRHRPRPNYHDSSGSPAWRQVYLDDKGAELQDTDVAQGGRVHERPGKCDQCDAKLHEVWYVNTEPNTDNIVEYFVGPSYKADGTLDPGEVIHTKKYWGSYTYGFAPLVSVYNEAKTLNEMVQYIKTFYDEERVPRGMLIVPTSNPDGFRSVWKEEQDKNVSANRHHFSVLTVDPGQGQWQPAHIELSKLPQELQYESIMDMFYRRIGAALGVMPVFHGNVDAVGLQNQGPQQYVVTKEAAKLGQQLYNDKVFPQLLAILGVRDWDLELNPALETNRMEELNEELLEIQVALSKMQLGLQFLEVDPSGKYLFSKKPMPMGPMGAMGAMGGMGGVPGPPMGPPGEQAPPGLDEGVPF